MSNAALDVVIWVLIYGGLLVVSLGIFLRRTAEGLGWLLIGGGALVAAIGAALVVVRARRPTDDGTPAQRPPGQPRK